MDFYLYSQKATSVVRRPHKRYGRALHRFTHARRNVNNKLWYGKIGNSIPQNRSTPQNTANPCCANSTPKTFDIGYAIAKLFDSATLYATILFIEGHLCSVENTVVDRGCVGRTVGIGLMT